MVDSGNVVRARRGRPPAPIVDRTPLDGARVDVSARVGWMLRMAREAARPDLGLRELVTLMADHGVGVSESTLSRLETGRIRVGALVDAYEEVLDLPPTSLRGPIDILCRGFAEPAGREPLDVSLAAISAGIEPVLEGESTAAGWLAFADALTHPDVVTLPRGLAREATERLASEVRRAVGPGYAARYEALSLARCSRYANEVMAVGLSFIDSEGAPPLLDLASALGELPSERLVDEMGARLGHDSIAVVQGAVCALENARVVGGLPIAKWHRLADPFVAAYEAGSEDPVRHAELSRLLRVLDPQLRAAVLPRLTRPLADPVRAPMKWTRDRTNEHFEVATAVATRLTSRLGLRDQPLLARLLFESLYDFRATREVTSSFLMMGLPFAADVVAEVAALATTGPDEVTRAGARALLPRLQSPWAGEHVAAWLADEQLAPPGAVALAQSGRTVPYDVVEPWLATDDPRRTAALVALGHCAHPALHDLARTAAPDVRVAARWLLDDGPRVAT